MVDPFPGRRYANSLISKMYKIIFLALLNSVYLSIAQFLLVFLSVCQSIYVFMSVYQYVCLSICLISSSARTTL